MKWIKRSWTIMAVTIFLVPPFFVVGSSHSGLKEKASSGFESLAFAAEEAKILTIDEVIKNTDPATATKAQIKEYFNKVKGKTDKGEGTVVDVLPPGIMSRGMPRITVLTAASKPEKGYNVVLLTAQAEAGSELQINDRIAFEGKIERISSFKGTSVDIVGTYKKIAGQK